MSSLGSGLHAPVFFGVRRALLSAAPLPLLALGPVSASSTAGAASGSLIASITGLSAGETATSISPNDGRIAITSGNALVVGLTASSAGTISYTVTTSAGRTLSIAVTAVPLTAMRATNAGFAPQFELQPSSGIAQTSRVVTAPFNEPFSEFEIIYQLFRTRAVSVTASIDNGAGAAGDILNVTAIGTGGVVPGITLVGTGVTTGTYVTSQLTGDTGGVGTYKLSVVQAGVVASGTITSTAFVDELFQNAGAVQTYEAGFLDAVWPSNAGILARTRATFDGGATSKTYTYATWDKSIGYLMTDKMSRGRVTVDPMELWTRVVLPSNGAGLPVNKLANASFADRRWGNELVTSGTSADPISATAIAGVTTVPANTSQMIVPVAIRIYTAGGAKTVSVIGDSRASFTGLGGNEPAGFGDSSGDLVGRGSAMERGIHGVAQQHSLMLGKPTDRAFYLAKAPGAWRFRRQIIQICGDDAAKVLVNAYGQNDQNDALVAWATGMDLPVGLAITTSSRVYVVTAAGVSGATAPSSTTLNTNITLGTATVRYYGTDATATNRIGLALGGKNYLINTAIRAAIPAISITQEALGPFTSSTDSWATAVNQADGFQAAAGKTYQTQLANIGATFTGADRVVSMMSLLGGSRTVNGGADDGSRTWITSGSATAYFATPDGIHHGNRGADIGKAAWTKLALTGNA